MSKSLRRTKNPTRFSRGSVKSQDEGSQQQRQQIENLLLVLNRLAVSVCKGKALSVLADVVSGMVEA